MNFSILNDMFIVNEEQWMVVARVPFGLFILTKRILFEYLFYRGKIIRDHKVKKGICREVF